MQKTSIVIVDNPAGIYQLTIETLEQGLKYVHSKQ